MATVQSLITSARYDLRDYGKGLVFDNAELLDYLNRMVGVMDSTLASIESDLVEAESDGDITFAEDATTADISGLNSGLWDSIRSVWIGTDQKTQVSVNEMRWKRIYDLTDGEPQYWALSGTDLLFEKTADDDYDLIIYYNKKTGTLALSSDMPYNSIFDELFREMLVLHAKAKKENKMLNTDQYYYTVFKNRAMEENIRRDYIKKTYSKDF